MAGVLESAQAKLGAAELHISQLEEREQWLIDELEVCRAQLAAARLEREHAAVFVESRSGEDVSLEAARDFAAGVGRFALVELTAHLRTDTKRAKKLLDVLLANGSVQPAGRVMGKPVFSFVKPEESGTAFEAQRKHLSAVPSPEERAVGEFQRLSVHYDGKASRAGSRGGSPLNAIGHPELRGVVAAAVRDFGWSLEHRGNHVKARRPGSAMVTIPCTPQNGSEAARQIARLLGVRTAS